jgi:hypothetical protein
MTLAEISGCALAISRKMSNQLISTSGKSGRERAAVVVIAIFVCGMLELNPFLHPVKADLPVAGCRAQRALGENARANHKTRQRSGLWYCGLWQGW